MQYDIHILNGDALKIQFPKSIDGTLIVMRECLVDGDLICQVHLWFACYLLTKFTKVQDVYLIRPTVDIKFGFGGMGESELIFAYKNRTKTTKNSLNTLAGLWPHYQQKAHDKMMLLAHRCEDEMPFLKAAIQANAERYPADGSVGRPEKTLLNIIEKPGTKNFSQIFRAFIETEAIYRYGDMQVKRLLSKLET